MANHLPTDDPGGYHDGIEHRPIVTVNNTKMVQLNPHLTYPHSNEALLRLQTVLQGLNSGSMSDGLIRHPAGSPEEGTKTNAFAVTLAPLMHVASVEAELRQRLERLQDEIPGAEFIGFVPSYKPIIVELMKKKN